MPAAAAPKRTTTPRKRTIAPKLPATPPAKPSDETPASEETVAAAPETAPEENATAAPAVETAAPEAPNTDRVVSLHGDVSIHVWEDAEAGTVRTVILSKASGNSAALADIPSYISDEIVAGLIPTVKIVSEAEAKAIADAVKGEFIDPLQNPRTTAPNSTSGLAGVAGDGVFVSA